jgi:endoglucanase
MKHLILLLSVAFMVFSCHDGVASDVTPNSTASDTTVKDTMGMHLSISSINMAKAMVPGWNVGNSLEASGSETSWGNPKVTQVLIDSVKKAGFKAIRIPVSWSYHFSDATSYTISDTWKSRVAEVVNYAIKDGMYVIINIHWDGGWMDTPTYAQQKTINSRLAIMWKQIAIYFRNYDSHLLFAGTNEVMMTNDYNAPIVEYYTVQNSFNQTFVSTVRSTGGHNKYRALVVQGFNANIDYTVNYLTLPTDSISDRLMVEDHYYDPYNFTLNTGTGYTTEWGKNATVHVDMWGQEDYADSQFAKLKAKYIDKGVPVIIGEYGAMARSNRLYYMQYISQSMKSHGLTPFVWDNGDTSGNGFGLFDRSTGAQKYPAIISAIVKQ